MILYLHGFASGPGSTKARALEERFGRLSVRLLIPDLTPGPDGFERSTPSSMLAIAEAALAAAPPPHAIIGSSLGGWLAALAASRNPSVQRLVLLAPAFRFVERWLDRVPGADLARWKRDGLEVDHHASGRRRRIRWEFMADAEKWPAWPRVKVPALCMAGTRDDVVPLADVERWVRQTPSARLVVLDDSHELVASVDRIFNEARDFLRLLVPGNLVF
jgi:pimeloyl-ACP methyl ester carboxylesterase